MALRSGNRLGPYEILSPLGAGGMGEVWRARDTRLRRDVALKVLNAALSRDPAALVRFEREAQAVAALSHPGILSLFDFGEAGGVRYAVAELLEGETLRALVARGALPVPRALDVAREVAEALAAAHGKGIVHRDLKPENVFLASDGHAKLLDFGLARQEAAAADRPDDAAPADTLTGESALLGTVAYMSPEQARGLPADHRSDQFALGVVLYEMLSGRRPFHGASNPQTLAALLHEEPEPLEAAAPSVPAPVRWLVGRCLAKDPADRWDSTRDLARELKTLSLHVSEARGEARAADARASRRRVRTRALLASAAVSLLLAGAAGAAFLLRREAPPAVPPVRFEVRLPDGYFLWPDSSALDLSPDGRLLVFSAFARKEPSEDPEEPLLFSRPLDALESRPIPGTAGGTLPSFSPDGRHVAFAAVDGSGRFLRTVAVSGGAARTVCECDAAFGIAWMPNGTILFAGADGPLQKVPATGGTPEPATALDGASHEVSHRLPHLLPDGRTVLFTAVLSPTAKGRREAHIFSARIGEERSRPLLEGHDGRWSPPGTLLFARDGRLFAAPFDAKAGRVTGDPVAVLEGVRHVVRTSHVARETGAAQVALAAGGLLAWGPGSVTPPIARIPVWVDASGRETPLEAAPSDSPTLGVRVSPDGKRVLLTYNYPGLEAEVVDLDRPGRRIVTFETDPRFAVWGPGPGRFTWASNSAGRSGIFARRLDAGPEEVETLWVTPAGERPGLVASWSRDGKVLAFVRTGPGSGLDIWLLRPGTEPRPFLATRFNEVWPDISPDGRWLLYSSNASGRVEAFVRPLSGEGGTCQVSTGEGLEPLWSRDGRFVYYWQDAPGSRLRSLYRVSVREEKGSLSFGVPARLLVGSFGHAEPVRGWDVAPDGRFLVRKVGDETTHRAWWDKLLSNRILVDTGGVARLLAEAKAGQ